MPDIHISKTLPAPQATAKQNLGWAILCLCTFSFLAAILDTHAKYLTQTLPVLQVTWARYFFHTLIIAPLVLYWYGRQALHPPNVIKQIIRGGLLFIATALYFLALARIPIAETQALVFSSPLIVTMLSPFLLSERVGIHRWSAVIIGFCGVLIVLNPTTNSIIDIGAFAALATGIVYAFYIITTRQLMHTPPLITLFFTGIVGSVILTISMPFVWEQPSPLEWLLMVTIGLCGACSHFFIIQAYRRAPASQISPWLYVKLLFTTASGYFLFRETPAMATWIGAAIIISSGIYIWWREQIVTKKHSQALHTTAQNLDTKS